MLPYMTHIALHVESIDQCIKFYQDFCCLAIVEGKHTTDDSGVVWLAESGREKDFVIVLIPNGYKMPFRKNDYKHLGFAVDSKSAVDEIAEKARQYQCLVWPPRQDAYPVGYYCGVKDPNGHIVEFSYGQPLGPKSKS